MKSNINIIPLTIINTIPNAFGSTVNRYFDLTDLHYVDGWRDAVIPIKSEHQRLGEMYFNKEKDIVTWRVLQMTEEEIESYEKYKLEDI